VSLTTYYGRFDSAHLAIESLLAQKCPRPFAVHLYLIDADIQKNGGVIPPRIEALTEKGLKIFVRNADHGPYNKLLFALSENPGAAIVTADDDILYPDDLLQRLTLKSLEHPGCIVCNYGYMLSFDRQGRFRHYYELMDAGEGPHLRREHPTIRLFPLGVGGVLYPPNALDDIVFDAELFSRVCPYNDDIWFKMASLRKNTLCVQTDAQNIKLATVEGRQEANLTHKNVKLGMNDRQFEACFQHYPDLLDKLKREFEQDLDYGIYDDWIKSGAHGGCYFVWVFKYLLYKTLSAVPPMKMNMRVKADKYARRLETWKWKTP
jgi:glycosyltransferase involved in cell wall biosynthesis